MTIKTYSNMPYIRVIKLKELRFSGHIARMGEKRNEYKVVIGKHEEKSFRRT